MRKVLFQKKLQQLPCHGGLRQCQPGVAGAPDFRLRGGASQPVPVLWQSGCRWTHRSNQCNPLARIGRLDPRPGGGYASGRASETQNPSIGRGAVRGRGGKHGHDRARSGQHGEPFHEPACLPPACDHPLPQRLAIPDHGPRQPQRNLRQRPPGHHSGRPRARGRHTHQRQRTPVRADRERRSGLRV